VKAAAGYETEAGREDGLVEGALGSKQARLRNWRPGDRVTLRYSSGAKEGEGGA